jgi:Tol biopolymer transport system component
MRHFFLMLVLLVLAASVGCPLASNTIEHGNVSFDASPDGETIVFSDAKGDLWLYALGNAKLTRLTESSELESWPSFSPDGKSIVFVKENTNGHGMSVHIMTIDGRKTRQIASADQCSDSQPVFSPDGTVIAFSRSHLLRRYSMGGWKWDNWDVYIVDLEGSDVKRLTHGNHYDIGGVAFSANSKHIYFTADEIRNSDSKETLFTITLDDSTVVATQPTKSGDYYAWWTDSHTNRNNEMVFISDRNAPFHYDVVFTRLDGQERSLGVTSLSRYNKNPVVTNDGKILFLAGTAWNSGSRPIFSLWSVTTDGTSTKELAGSALFTDPLEWARQQSATEPSDEREPE